MRIGLVGAPGAGKSRFGLALSFALDTDEVTYFVADGYAENYASDNDFAIGEDATYLVNLGIAHARIHEERRLGDNVVSCGTMLDTATYMVCERTLFPDDPTWRRRHMSSLAVAGCMVNDLMTYDHVFYLPLAEEPENTFLRDVAATLPTSLRLFEIPHTTLDSDDTQRNVALALNVIHASAAAN